VNAPGGAGRRRESGDSWASVKADVAGYARLLAGIVLLLWAVLAVDLLLGGTLRGFGVRPREVGGLVGIPLHPLLHVGVFHLLMNTIGIAALGGLVLLRDERDFWLTTTFGVLVGGTGTWLLGSAGVHIGASGVVFAYFGYLLTTGLFERRIGALVLSAIVFLAWGGLLLGLLPGQRGISWEGHLFGFLAGLLVAWMRARKRKVAAG